MINESQARKYCREDITLIKNYAEAVADKTKTWICHHINGEPFTGFCKADLKKMNMYYQRPASELLFVTRGEHNTIHGKGIKFSEESRKKISDSNKCRTISEETRKKMSDSRKGKTGYFKGKTFSEDHRKKLSESHKGKTLSKETRKKLSEASEGKHWYNNGIVNKFAKSCPEGFVKGMLHGSKV